MGPRRIVQYGSPLVYVVEQLGTGSRERVHFDPIARYSAHMDGSTVSSNILNLADRTDS